MRKREPRLLVGNGTVKPKYCLHHRRNKRLACYAMPNGQRRGPLLFYSATDAKWYCRKIAGKDWRPKMLDTEGIKRAVMEYGEGRFMWGVNRQNGKAGYSLMCEMSLSEVREELERARMPLRHASLTPELERLCRETYESVGKYRSPTYEQWEFGFLHDTHPDKELAIWKEIGAALRAWAKRHPGGDMKMASVVLCLIATGVDRNTLPLEYVDLVEFYTGPISPLVFGSVK